MAKKTCVYCEKGIHQGQGMSLGSDVVLEGDFAHKKCYKTAQRRYVKTFKNEEF